jgi:hypothetical protein
MEGDIVYTTNEKSRLGKVVNRGFVACQEKPTPFFGLVPGCVLRENLLGVELGIDRNRNQAQAIVPQISLQKGHPRTHARTWSGAAGKNEIGNPDLSSQISEAQVLPTAFNQREIRQLGENWQGVCSEKAFSCQSQIQPE